DIRQFVDFTTAQDALSYEARLTRVLSKLAGMSKPTIAMLQGDAIGGGLFIALACDLRPAPPPPPFRLPAAPTPRTFPPPLRPASAAARRSCGRRACWTPPGLRPPGWSTGPIPPPSSSDARASSRRASPSWRR